MPRPPERRGFADRSCGRTGDEFRDIQLVWRAARNVVVGFFVFFIRPLQVELEPEMGARVQGRERTDRAVVPVCVPRVLRLRYVRRHPSRGEFIGVVPPNPAAVFVRGRPGDKDEVQGFVVGVPNASQKKTRGSARAGSHRGARGKRDGVGFGVDRTRGWHDPGCVTRWHHFWTTRGQGRQGANNAESWHRNRKAFKAYDEKRTEGALLFFKETDILSSMTSATTPTLFTR